MPPCDERENANGRLPSCNEPGEKSMDEILSGETKRALVHVWYTHFESCVELFSERKKEISGRITVHFYLIFGEIHNNPSAL